MSYKRRFGSLSEDYDRARLPYPREAIEYICSLIKKGRKILDLGCGTGIATRQLAYSGLEVIGCDSDERMIERAINHRTQSIRYCTASADNLPFNDKEFDMVTAFGAFHWFRDKRSLSEIKRVIKKDGLFVVVNKNDKGRFRKDYRKEIIKIIGDVPPSVKKGYSPERILINSGFSEVQKRVYKETENFTIDEAITLIKSTGIWNHVPWNIHQEVTESLNKSLSKTANKGVIKRPIEVIIVHGKIIR